MGRRVGTVWAWALFVLLAGAAGAAADPLATSDGGLTAEYPEQWEVPVPTGTRLDDLRTRYDRRPHGLPARDLEDRSPLPVWFRAYLRDDLPGLPTSGAYQYPRWAWRHFQWMLNHPNLEAPSPADADASSPGQAPAARTAAVGPNINMSNAAVTEAESAIAIDYRRPQRLIAASTSASDSIQTQFASSDGGRTWSRRKLPLVGATVIHDDPTVAWSSDGTAWTMAMGRSSPRKPLEPELQLFESTDGGVNWSYVSSIPGPNDKQMMWIDPHDASPFKDTIYAAWNINGAKGVLFARSTDRGATWSPVTRLSPQNDSPIGLHLTTGPAGELYVAWPDTESQELRVRKSTDGGATFGPIRIIAETNAFYDVSIPAQCYRNALIYVSLAVDRSNGPRQGWVYVTWTDLNAPKSAEPGCDGLTSEAKTSVYFSRSTDGGQTWSAPRIIDPGGGLRDQFNQWLDADPTDGTIHVAYYDTRNDPERRKTDVFHLTSADGGDTWGDPTRVTTAQSTVTAGTGASAFQYGDYNGLVAFEGVAHPVWTDRRPGLPGNRQQVFTALVGPAITLGLNRKIVDTGDRIVLTIRSTAVLASREADVYVTLELPDDTVLYLQPDATFGPTARPALRNWTIEPTLADLSATFSGAELQGTYVVSAYFTTPGTDAVISNVAQAAFVFEPEKGVTAEPLLSTRRR